MVPVLYARMDSIRRLAISLVTRTVLKNVATLKMDTALLVIPVFTGSPAKNHAHQDVRIKHVRLRVETVWGVKMAIMATNVATDVHRIVKMESVLYQMDLVLHAAPEEKETVVKVVS